MRVIETKETREKSERTKRWIVGIFLIGIMLFSTLGYAAYEWGRGGNSGTTLNYNGLKFNLENGYWTTTINSVPFTFLYQPTKIEKRSWDVKGIEYYSSLPLYFSSDSGEAQQEIVRNFYGIVTKTQEACLSGEKCNNEKLPIKSCNDNFILIRESNVTEIRQNDSCVFITGSYENLTMLADEFLYHATKIIN